MSRRSTKARRGAQRRTRNRRLARELGEGQIKNYGPDGRVITFGEWAVLFERRSPERFLATTRLPGRRRVSTVWLGIDLALGTGDRPLIFESMVFARPEGGRVLGEPLDQARYATRAEALKGHRALVQQWKGRP